MQQIPACGPNTMETLRQNFATNHCNIQKLIVEIALTACEDSSLFATPPLHWHA